MSNSKKTVRLINESTGETAAYEFKSEDEIEQTFQAFEGFVNDLGRKAAGASVNSKANWVRLLMNAALELPEHCDGNHSFSTVFIVMCGKVAYGGRIAANRAQIAELAKVSDRTARRAIAVFKEKGIVKTKMHEGREYLYFTDKVVTRGSTSMAHVKPNLKLVKSDK